jgi:hypothetical protein
MLKWEKSHQFEGCVVRDRAISKESLWKKGRFEN